MDQWERKVRGKGRERWTEAEMVLLLLLMLLLPANAKDDQSAGMRALIAHWLQLCQLGHSILPGESCVFVCLCVRIGECLWCVCV